MPDELKTQLVNPNLHAILIHFPIGLLFIGALIETLAFLWPRSTFRVAGRWMILIGALAAIPAATTGLYAARQAMKQPDMTLAQLKEQAALSVGQWYELNRHWRMNGIAVVLLALLIVAWLGSSDRIRHKAHFVFLLLLLIAVGLMAKGAWHGGEMVFTHATGTRLIVGGWPRGAEKPEHPSNVIELDSSSEKGKWAFDALHKTGEQVARFDDAVDVHAQMAGWTVALALATLGLSIRALWLGPVSSRSSDLAAHDDDILHAIAGKQSREQKRPLMEPQLPTELPAAPRYVRTSRFWLLTALLAIFTAIGGWMVASPGSMHDVIAELNNSLRMKAHFIAGVSIVVLTLLLALVTRFGRHNKILVGCFALLLATALAAQLWLGLLLLFDTDEGPINHFNVPTTQQSVT